MIIITCLDDHDGMMFHNRRQSQDRGLREYIAEMTKEETVYMNAYTKKLYEEIKNPVVSEDFLQKAGKGENCIVEDRLLAPVIDKIEEIIIFRWNKVYPSDQVLDVDLEEWKLVEEEKIKGSTHEITKQIYLRNDQADKQK